MGHDGHIPRNDDEWAAQLLAIEPKALRHAHSKLGNPDDAKDAVWETMGRLVARGPFTPDTSLEAYVITAVTNTCHSKFRWHVRHPETSLTAEDGKALDVVDTQPDALTALLEEETRESIGRALGKLSPEYRELLNMRYVEGLTLQEISDRIGLSIPTVHHHLKKAVAQLARILKEGGVHV